MRVLRLLIILVSFSVYSQNKDTLYVKSFSHKINIRTSLELEEQALDVTNLNDLNNYSLRQNEVGKLALSLNYNIVGLKVGFSPDFLKNDTYFKGTSKFRHYRIRVFFPKLYQQFYYYKTKGFYIKNTKDFIQDWQREKTHIYIYQI